MTQPQLMTIAEVVAYLRVDRSAVWRWCVAGKLSAFKAGRSWRIYESGLDEFVKAGMPQPAERASESESKL